MIRLILVEDYAIIRAGLCMLIEKYEDITVVAAVADGESSLKLVQEHQPDIVLMDIELPGINGLHATAQILHQCPNVPVLLLSNHASEAYVLQAIQAGAKGYVKKDSDISDIRKAIDTVLAGQIYLAPNVSSHLVSYLAQQTAVPPLPLPPKPATDELTTRQIEILTCLAEGLSTKEIAERMIISVKTVETHRTNIMNRLNIYHIAGLTRYAIEQGLITA